MTRAHPKPIVHLGEKTPFTRQMCTIFDYSVITLFKRLLYTFHKCNGTSA